MPFGGERDWTLVCGACRMPADKSGGGLRLPRAAIPAGTDDGERYLPAGTLNDIGLEHFHRYLLAARYAAGKQVADVACGSGYGAALLAQRAAAVVGVDRHAPAIEAARLNYPMPGLRFELGDAQSMPLADACIDLLLSFETIEHLDEPARLVAEAKRVLRPGGMFMVSTPDRPAYAVSRGNQPNPWHLHEMDAAEFEALLRARFAHVAIYGQRVTYGSVIWPMTGELAPALPVFSTSDAAMERFDEAAPPRPIYLLAIASDSALPQDLGTAILEAAGLNNPLASLQGGIRDRDAEIARLRREIFGLSASLEL